MCYNIRVATASFSARLDSNLLARLKRLSAREGLTASQLAERYIEEGVRSAELPGIVFRPGPTGRRAGLHGGPDVWEIVRDVQRARARRARDAVRVVVRSTDLTEEQVRLALAYYAHYPDDVDERIAAAEELEFALTTEA